MTTQTKTKHTCPSCCKRTITRGYCSECMNLRGIVFRLKKLEKGTKWQRSDYDYRVLCISASQYRYFREGA